MILKITASDEYIVEDMLHTKRLQEDITFLYNRFCYYVKFIRDKSEKLELSCTEEFLRYQSALLLAFPYSGKEELNESIAEKITYEILNKIVFKESVNN